MESLLTSTQHDQTAWFWMPLFLVVACYFRFERLWSIRNLDLAILLLLPPGILFLEADTRYGQFWFLAIAIPIFARVLVDGLLKRRPRLAQNLNLAGLSFIAALCCLVQSAFIYSFDRQPNPPLADKEHRNSAVSSSQQDGDLKDSPPLRKLSTSAPQSETGSAANRLTDRPLLLHRRSQVIRILTAISHLLIAAGLLLMGWRYFGDLSLGVGMATLYLLLPQNAYFATEPIQVLPCVLLLAAVLRFQYPLQSGVLLGIATAIFFFPVFLIPLWLSFYGRRNSLQFAAASAIGFMIALVAIFVSPATGMRESFLDSSLLVFSGEGTDGIWAGVQSIWRLPIFVLFLVMVGVFCWWPNERTLEVLVARLTALLIGIQLWNIQGAGVFPLWYTPLFLIVVFRPNLPHLASPNARGWSLWPIGVARDSQKQPYVMPRESEPLRAILR